MKTKKLIFILTIMAIVFGCNLCYAVDLNMTDDLTDFSQNTSTNNIMTNTNMNSNTTNTNKNYDLNTTNSNITSNESNTNNFSSSIPDTALSGPSSTTVSDVNSKSSTGLEFTTILNIMLIVIGTLLVLLAIAILIRLKK